MSDDVSTSDPLFLAGRIALLSSLCAMLMHKSYGKDSRLLDKVIDEALEVSELENRPGRFHRGVSFQFHEMRRVLDIPQDKGA